VIVSEDRSGSDRIIGITLGGRHYVLARNVMDHSEIARVVFLPDGLTLFASMQHPRLTLAITGP
jgi:secreted PhoX family phosphatase